MWKAIGNTHCPVCIILAQKADRETDLFLALTLWIRVPGVAVFSMLRRQRQSVKSASFPPKELRYCNKLL
ncbi:hypothetical protein CEXT_515161 [Caerostris extrusa]|uniref:Uncharacterized protein n=1 Tax=Caerostris extrusa TaxID=172846 RepID=A0AAV4MMA7_CAEEX|nr:hypothetical protein CEXT_515161 [Caerostris extrusa]